ncbi:autotransporter assembly complex protein TamA [Woodsholea maritima]|uniref:autotransporter assembly complex protein TamA n=1 Tax=Woodsholea maritima TaxID=240237 RepID=UPI000376341B|nr:BamA/TamA family outer membrane protein [Woodsholea maritima]
MTAFASAIFSLTSLALAGPTLEGVEDADLHRDISQILETYTQTPSNGVEAWRQGQDSANEVTLYLRSKGYYGARVIPRVDDDLEVVIDIEIGPVYTVGTVEISTREDERAKAVASAAIPVEPGDPLEATAILNAEGLGLAALQTSGWPDADTGFRRVIVDHARGDSEVVYDYRPGEYSINGEVYLSAPGWRESFIRRLSPLEPGAPTSRDDLSAYQRALQNLASVQSAEVLLTPAENDQTARDIEVVLEPRKRHALEASLSYSTSEGAGTDNRWSRRNVYGGDETFSARLQLATLIQGVESELLFPHWRRLHQDLKLSAGAKSENTDAYDQQEVFLAAHVTRRHVGPFTLGAGVRLDGSHLKDSEDERDFLSLELPLSALYDTRDNPLNPDDGWNIGLLVTPVITTGGAGSGYVRFDTRAASYWPLSDRVLAAARVRFGTIVGTSSFSIPADHRFFAGGGGSARGYAYQELSPKNAEGVPIGGRSVVEFNTELRWHLREKWGVVAFVDAATTGDDTTPDMGELRYGIGMGLRYYLSFAPIRVDVAMPVDKRDGEDPFQVYFSLGQAF